MSLPPSRSCFFEQAILEGQLGDKLFHIPRLTAQGRDLTGSGLTGGVPDSRFLPLRNSFDQLDTSKNLSVWRDDVILFR